MRDTTQIPQPIAPAPELISTYPEMPKKLASIDPDFRRYHEENDRRYKRIREAFAEAQTHLALPVALVKLAQDRLDQAQVKLASELATANAKALAQAGTLLAVGTEIDDINGTLTSHATSINTLLSAVGGGDTDLAEITSRIDGMEATFAQADEDLRGNIDTWALAQTTLASEVLNTTTGLPSAHSKIHTEEQTRITDNNTMSGQINAGAQRITALESVIDGDGTNPGLAATVYDIANTYVDAGGATAAANSAISASLGSGVYGTIGATVTTLQEAMTRADGFLSGKYTLAVTANTNGSKVVTGMNITSTSYAGEVTSEVRFQADKFLVTNATGDQSVVPFEISGGVVYINDAMIKSLAASKILAGTLDAMSITGSTITGGTIEGAAIYSTNPDTGRIATFRGGLITAPEINCGALSAITFELGTGTISGLTSTNVTSQTGRVKDHLIVGNDGWTSGRITANEFYVGPLAPTDSTYGPRVMMYGSMTPGFHYAAMEIRGETVADTTTIWGGAITAASIGVAGFHAAAGADFSFNTDINRRMRFGECTSVGAFIPSGYITIKDSSGTIRKLAVIQ